MIVAEKFKEHFAPGHFSRINTEHPLDNSVIMHLSLEGNLSHSWLNHLTLSELNNTKLRTSRALSFR